MCKKIMPRQIFYVVKKCLYLLFLYEFIHGTITYTSKCTRLFIYIEEPRVEPEIKFKFAPE